MAGTTSFQGWRGLILAVVCAAIGLALLALPWVSEDTAYLIFLLAVTVTAFLASRWQAWVVIWAFVLMSGFIASEGFNLSVAINDLIFIIVAGLITEVCHISETSRHQTGELALKVAEQDVMLNTVLASIPMITLDGSGRILKANGAAAELFGTDPEQLKQRPFQDLIPDFEPSPSECLDEAQWTGTRADGTPIPLSIRHSRLPRAWNSPHVAVYLADLSRLHAADAQARELHTQLNKVWRLNSLGEMAATLAHELNQPLSAAATYLHASQVDMERAGLVADNARRSTELAKAQLLRAGTIIRRMRELLSLEIGSLDTDRAASMVEDLNPVLTMIGSARHVAVRLELDNKNDGVRADRIQFQQAIVNLVRNAVEALGSRPNPEVVVIGRPISDTLYEIRVEDNGPGLPPDEVERMFQPMTSTKSGGMGLGLSVTRTIVERHGGRLTVASSPSGGACFSFNLVRDPVDRDQ